MSRIVKNKISQYGRLELYDLMYKFLHLIMISSIDVIKILANI